MTKIDCQMPESSSGLACILDLVLPHELHQLGVVGGEGLEFPPVLK